jgi:hypothetical protein
VTAKRELVSAIAARERGRSRLRAATFIVGTAGLLTTGVIAWNLPSPGHGTTGASVAAQAAPTTQATPSTQPSARRDEGDDDGHHVTVTPGGTGTTAPASHATSGGSAVLP